MDIYHITTQELLERISRHCPESLYVYLHCMNRVNDFGTAFFTRKQVEEEMSEGWTKFKNNVKKLARENLVDWHIENDGITIRIVSDEMDE